MLVGLWWGGWAVGRLGVLVVQVLAFIGSMACPSPPLIFGHSNWHLPTPLQGTSRGGANVKEIVRRIDLWGLNMVFVVGGNGGNAAAHAIAEECLAQV